MGDNRKDVVLIVDDEPVIRRLLRHTLQIADYEVIEAADGLEAIALLEQETVEISAVLSDITMPRMDGIALVEKLHLVRPELPVVLASGLHGRDTIPSEIASRITGFIEKPYSQTTVLEAVATAIERSRAA